MQQRSRHFLLSLTTLALCTLFSHGALSEGSSISLTSQLSNGNTLTQLVDTTVTGAPTVVSGNGGWLLHLSVGTSKGNVVARVVLDGVEAASVTASTTINSQGGLGLSQFFIPVCGEYCVDTNLIGVVRTVLK
jgi:hypothetical protein